MRRTGRARRRHARRLASRYESASFETSSVGEPRMTARARGPATFTAASAPVTSDDLDVHAPDRVPPLEPLEDGVRAGRRRRHVEGLVVEARDRAVVHDPARVRVEDAVADPPRLHVGEAVRVEPLEERRPRRGRGRAACRAWRRRSRRPRRARSAPRPPGRRRSAGGARRPSTSSSRRAPCGGGGSTCAGPARAGGPARRPSVTGAQGGRAVVVPIVASSVSFSRA